ncbi:S8 family serine peptidase, partial [candidate division KSB1 bacterium]
GVTVVASKKQLLTIKELPYVKEVKDFHEHKPKRKIESPRPENAVLAANSSTDYGFSEGQVKQLGLDNLHDAGYTGKGVIIAVIDCGFKLSHKAFNHPEYPLKVIAQWDFVENDNDVIPRPEVHTDYYDHGTGVLGVVASYAPGELLGSGYDAGYILCNAEDGTEEYYLEERWYVAALEFAESQGADVLTSSLVLYDGYSPKDTDGNTSIMTKGMNIAVGNGVICMAGAGNDGNDQDPDVTHLMIPGDAENVIAVGAVQSNSRIASFSSDGPTIDGRLKPEVLAMGSRVWTISLLDNNGYIRASGTSVATPLLAGAVACIMQAHPEWTVQKLREALFHSGDYYIRNGKPDPLYIHGYGIPNVYEAAGKPVKKE